MRIRLLCGVVALAFAGTALAGFNSSLLGFAGIGTYSGHAPSEAENNLLVQAIGCIRKSGRGDDADKLTKMLNGGDICIEENSNPDGNGGKTNGTGEPADYGEINIRGGSFISKEVLAAILLHELEHVKLGDDADSPDSQHCKAYWIEFKYVCEFLDANGVKSGGEYKPKPGASLSEKNDVLQTNEQWKDILSRCPEFATLSKSLQHPPWDEDKDFDQNRARTYRSFVGNTNVFYRIGSGNDVVVRWFDPTGSDPSTQESIINIPVNELHQIFYTTTATDEPVIVAVGSNPGGAGKVFALTDSDSDGIIDDSQMICNPSDGLDCPSSVVAIDTPSGALTWFILDTDLQEIWMLADTDSDGVPDGAGAKFAAAASFPDLALAKSLVRVGEIDCDGNASGTTYVAFQNVGVSYRMILADEWAVALSDTDADGDADVATPRNYAKATIEFRPKLWDHGRTSESTVTARLPRGHQARVMGFDTQAGEFSTVLGTGTASATDIATVTLSGPLVEGQRFVIEDFDTGKTSVEYVAEADAPRLTSLSPTYGPTSGGTHVVLTGSGFGTNPTLTLGGVPMVLVSATDTEIVFVTLDTGTWDSSSSEIWIERSDNGKSVGGWTFLFEDR